MKYDASIKSARMNATRQAVGGGALELVSESGSVLARFKLTHEAGNVSGDTWTVGFDSDRVLATNGGRATSARICSASGSACISGLTVGMSASKADVVISNTQVNKGQQVSLTGEQSISHA